MTTVATTDDFGQWLRRRRKALGLTQKALALQAGCAEVTLRKIEAGNLQPSAPLVASLAQALGVADADLPALVALARGLDDDFTARARLLRPQRPNNLPAQLTPLIGRSRDITAVRRRLIDDGARLITLVGPPGVGKTRLSLAVAADVLEQFDDGAFFVRLGPISDPDLVAAAIAQTLGLQMTGPNPPELQLRAYLEEKHLLLVLDNFEQIVAAAALVDDLLRRCPWLHVLVTSRQPLRVRGERQIHVLPLALPAEMAGASAITAADMLRYPSVALFADRAEAVLPDFTVDDGNALAVAELCRRLDGLPLAIELVAARVKLLPPSDLLTRLHGPWLLSADGLRDVSARQRTLRGAIGWSYDLLSPAEQTLFRCLSVFVGGFTLEAAELLCGDTLSPPLPLTFTATQVLDGIGSLLDKNLLYREAGLNDEPRCAMLETVREYGLERVDVTGEDAMLYARHVSCYLQIVQEAEVTDLHPVHIQLLRQIDDEIHNIRAALAWAKQYDIQAALLFTAILLGWFHERGLLTEGRRLIDEVLALPGANARTIPRAKMLSMVAFFLSCVNKIAEAQSFAEESLDLTQELGYGKGEAEALLRLGRIAQIGWYNQDTARNYLERALANYRTLADPGGICCTLVVSSEVALLQGDYPRARALAEECLSVADHAGFSYPWPLATLATLALGEGDLNRARSLDERRMAADRSLRSRGGLVYTLADLGNVSTRQGDYTSAHAFLGEALALAKQLGEDWLSGCFLYLAVLNQAEGDYHGAVRYYRESVEGTKQYRWIWSPCLLGLAALTMALGRYELTARLLGATEAVDKTAYRLMPDDRNEYDRLAEVTLAHLGTSSFNTAWTDGLELAFEQAAEEAVSILEGVLRVETQTSSM